MNSKSGSVSKHLEILTISTCSIVVYLNLWLEEKEALDNTAYLLYS